MRTEILRFVRAAAESPPDVAAFDAAAVALFGAQTAANPIYAAIAEGAAPTRAEDIPAVPVALFKELELCAVPAHEARVTFRTSGTTGQVRGVVHLRDTDVYDAGSALHAARCVASLPRRAVSLCPTEPDSSLGHMVALLGADGVVPLFSADVGVAADAWDRIAEEAARGPIFLAATAFALDALFTLPGAAPLDARSVLMVTGGFKGRRARLDAPELYAAVPARLGAPRVVGEYGMTELSSQLWTDPVAAGTMPGAFRAPPWMRVYAVDPVSGAPVARGEAGVLRFVDLCNVDSVVAIETMDLGVVDGDRVTLIGRLEGAEARGCSLRAEAFVSAARAEPVR
jgi:hypothetical protein